MPVEITLEVVNPLGYVAIAGIEIKYYTKTLKRLGGITSRRVGNAHIIPESHGFV
jgi:hypothetical protein